MTEKAEATQAETPAQNPLMKSVTFTVSAAELKSGIDAELKRYAKTAKIAGFRAGHVPFATVQAMYGQQAYVDTLNRLIGREFEKAAKEANLMMVGMPEIKSEESKEGEDLKFTGTVECYPEIELPDFSGLELKKYVCPVTDAEVAKTIDVMVKQRATYEEEAGRAAQAEDRVTLNFKGTKDGVAFEGGTAEGFVFVIAQGRMLPDFEAAVTGMKAGEQKSFNMTFPKEYGAKDLAGQEVTFELDVTKVEKPIYPAVDDAFAKTLGLDTAEALNAEVRRNLEREVTSRLDARTKGELMEAIYGLCTFAVPQAMVADEQKELAEQAKRDMAARGMDTKKMPQMPLELFTEQAKRRVTLGILVNKLVTVENLQATEADVDAIIEKMASAYEKPEEMRAWFKKDQQHLAGLYNVATEDKVVACVLGKAKVTEETVEFDKVMAYA